MYWESFRYDWREIMPIKVPNNLPAVETLTRENVFVMTDTRAMTQDIRPLQILILNLMPTKIDTETQLTRLLGNTPLQVELELLQTSSHKAQNTSEEHMLAFYKTFEQIQGKYYDGMIITGAPVELLEFEEVEYWDELCQIMEWSKTHVHSTFHICWGAQAGLYYHYGIKKRKLPKKLSGVYKHTLEYKTGMLFRGFDDEFYVPHSRNTTVLKEDIEKVPELGIVSCSEEAGVFAVKSTNDRQIFIMGHSEYDADTLKKEYDRDKAAGINPEVPCNYFPGDDDTKEPIVTWRSCANLLFCNWLNYFVYQSTPYDINMIKEDQAQVIMPTNKNLVVSKFGGSSLADSTQFLKAAEIASEDINRKCIVVSAPGKRFSKDFKVTDLLLDLADADEVQEQKVLLGELTHRFDEIIRGIGLTDFDLDSEIKDIENTMAKLPVKEKKQFVASRGEHISAKIMASYLGYRFVDSKDIIFLKEDGSADLERTSQAIDKMASNLSGESIVVPGFYGCGANGEIATFSRGGSDITGAILAAGLKADLYENWTDVSGFLMADPKIVENPMTVPIITYREVRELSYMGANVMHEDAVFPVTKLEIPIQIKNTNAPFDQGTLIVKNADYYKGGSLITGISGRKGYLSLMIFKEKLNDSPDVRAKILTALEEIGISSKNIIAEVDSLTVIAEQSLLASLKKGRNNKEVEALIKQQIDKVVKDTAITISDDLAIIGIVGRNIAGSPEIAVKVLNALASRRINIKLLDHGPGKINMTIGVDEADYESAIVAVYNQLAR